MAHPKHDGRHRRRGRRLLPLWLIVGLVGIGVALAAYQQQRRGAIDVAEAPQEEPAGEVAEGTADPTAPPDRPDAASSEGGDAEVAAPRTDEATATARPEAPATGPPTEPSAGSDPDLASRPDPTPEDPSDDGSSGGDPVPDEPPAVARDAAPPAQTETEPSRVETERAPPGESVATLEPQDRDPEPPSAPRMPAGAEPSEAPAPAREPAETAAAPPSGDSERPDAEAEQVETEQVETEQVETEQVETEQVETERAETEQAEVTPGESDRPTPAPGDEPAPPGEIARAEPAPRPAGETRGRQEAVPPEGSAEAAGPGTEALAADTIRRALEAMLGGVLDQPVAAPPPGEPPAATPEDALAEVKGPAATGPAPETRMAAVDPTEAETAAKPVAPSFDLVRVERSGQAVIAGRAAPGAEVELRAGDEPIDRVRADRRGHWVSVPVQRLPAGQQELTVAALSGDGRSIPSEQVVVLAVPGSEPIEGTSDHPAAAPVALEARDDEALAVLLPRDGEGLGRVLQAPGRIGSDGQLALLMLDYDETGDIQLSGEASPGAAVRVYVDNRLSAETIAREDGAWTCTLDRALEPGTYTLRVDQIDGGGATVARLETPFTRVARPPVDGDVLVDYVVVQPGNSLWRIARRLFGSGFRYVHIYEANQAQIRDPDLIYPGQVFEIPVGTGSAG